MSDIVVRKRKNELGNTSEIQITLPVERVTEFKTILNRALNTWADAPPEWKELSDILEHGQMLQDYYIQTAYATQRLQRNKHGV